MQLIYSLIYMVIEFQIKETIEKFISFKYAGGFRSSTRIFPRVLYRALNTTDVNIYKGVQSTVCQTATSNFKIH